MTVPLVMFMKMSLHSVTDLLSGMFVNTLFLQDCASIKAAHAMHVTEITE